MGWDWYKTGCMEEFHEWEDRCNGRANYGAGSRLETENDKEWREFIDELVRNHKEALARLEQFLKPKDKPSV